MGVPAKFRRARDSVPWTAQASVHFLKVIQSHCAVLTGKSRQISTLLHAANLMGAAVVSAKLPVLFDQQPMRTREKGVSRLKTPWVALGDSQTPSPWATGSTGQLYIPDRFARYRSRRNRMRGRSLFAGGSQQGLFQMAVHGTRASPGRSPERRLFARPIRWRP